MSLHLPCEAGDSTGEVERGRPRDCQGDASATLVTREALRRGSTSGREVGRTRLVRGAARARGIFSSTHRLGSLRARPRADERTGARCRGLCSHERPDWETVGEDDITLLAIELESRHSPVLAVLTLGTGLLDQAPTDAAHSSETAKLGRRDGGSCEFRRVHPVWETEE